MKKAMSGAERDIWRLFSDLPGARAAAGVAWPPTPPAPHTAYLLKKKKKKEGGPLFSPLGEEWKEKKAAPAVCLFLGRLPAKETTAARSDVCNVVMCGCDDQQQAAAAMV